MNVTSVIRLSGVVLLGAALTFLRGGDSTATNPPGYHLFKIDRNKDRYVIYYDLKNPQQGKLDKENPISIYWLKNGKTEPLSWIQEKYAYGLNYIKKTEHEAAFQFVSYDKRSLLIRKDAGGQYRVYVVSQNKTIELNRIFLQIDGGSFWLPKISRVELHGHDIHSRAEHTEIIHP